MKSAYSRINALTERFSDLLHVREKLVKFDERFEEIKINQGLILSALNERQVSTKLQDYEFKVFSQWGEDGIIQRLTKIVQIKNRTFIEFGVENFYEANCRFLLMKDNWSGFVIDGSAQNVKEMRNSYFYWKYSLNAIDAFITRDNIDDLLAKSGFDGDLGILSVDLDGNDYYVLEAISNFRPRILICEYNAVFGATRKISVPYDPSFIRANKHSSNLYWGASLAAVTFLAEKNGYELVGTNSVGSNAFYVRNDLLTEKVEVLSVGDAYAPSTFRESRDGEGNLTFVDGADRLEAIKGMPVFNVETGVAETL
jgi:hypothetical protein